jgi:membrane protein
VTSLPQRPDQALVGSGPLGLRLRCWWRAIKRTVSAFREKDLMDSAAALTYYAVLSIFPMLIVLVALLGLLGQYPQTTDALLNIIDEVGRSSAAETLRRPVEEVVQRKGDAGALLGIGLVLALWSASGYIGGFMRASNIIYGVEEGRSFWLRRPLQLVMTIAFVVLLAMLAMLLVITGDLAEAIGHEIGIGDSGLKAWSILKWPLLAAIVMAIVGTLYYLAPNVKHPGFRWITPGGILSVVVWVAASAGFGLYVSYLASYNSTYGSLGAVIVFLVWLWISNIALLLGAQFNVELVRARELEAGVPHEDTLSLELRSEPSSD